MKRRSRSQAQDAAAVVAEEGSSGNKDAVVEIAEAGEGDQGSEATRLRQEIVELRAALAHKTAKLHALEPQMAGQSDTVRRVLELLGREEGATKAQLVEATGAKKAYVEALLNRILPSKGYSISSAALEGAKVKTYHLPQKAAV